MRDQSTILLVNTQFLPKETIMPKGVEVAAWQDILAALRPHQHFVGCNPFDERGKASNRIWAVSKRGKLCPVLISCHTTIKDAVRKARKMNREGGEVIQSPITETELFRSLPSEETGL